MTPPHTPAPATAGPLPTTVWLAPHPDSTPSPTPSGQPGRVLPPWALARIRRDLTPTPGTPAPLIHTLVRDTAPSMDARAHTTTAPGPDWPCPGMLLLAELHPDTLPDTDPTTSPTTQPPTDGWSGFLHRTHRVLHRGGLLLLATRQRRDHGHLTDPLGALIACARTAGFTYLQHIVIVHGHADGDQLTATPPDPTTPQLLHSDLLIFDSQPAGHETQNSARTGTTR